MAVASIAGNLSASAWFSLALLAASASAAAPPSAKAPAKAEVWRSVGAPLPGYLGLCRSLVRHRDALFAALDSGVFRSRDGGESWQRVSSQPSRTLASDGRKLYAGGPWDMQRSADGGGTWTSISGSLNIGTVVMGLALAQGNLYAAVNEAGVYRSRDEGENWMLSTEGMGRNPMFAVAATGASVLAGTMRGIFVSRDAGTTWREADGPDKILSLLVHEGRVFAGTLESGVWSSDDLGGTWDEESAELDDGSVFALCAWKGAVLAGTGSTGVYRFESARDIWAPMGRGLETQGIGALVAAGSDLYAAGDSARVWCLGPGCAP